MISKERTVLSIDLNVIFTDKSNLLVPRKDKDIYSTFGGKKNKRVCIGAKTTGFLFQRVVARDLKWKVIILILRNKNKAIIIVILVKSACLTDTFLVSIGNH